MTRPFLARLSPIVLALVAFACSGTSDSLTAPSGASGPAGPPSSSGASCTAGVIALPTLVPWEGGSFPFRITAASTCGWTLQTDVAWATVTLTSGHGNATTSLNVSANINVDGRSAMVMVNDQSFQVRQLSGCEYSVDPTSLNLDAAEESSSIAVVATLAECPWTAMSGESWIRVLTASGTGTSTIALTLDPNPGDERHTFLMIAGIRVEVTQSGL